MYAQVAIKPNTLLRNGAYGIVMRGVQKCTCAGASLRGRNSAPLCCIKLDTATDPCMGSGSLLLNAKKFSTEPNYIKYYGQEHLNDVFVTEGDQSISARDKILREVVSNILAHRDYSNAYSAKFVIEQNVIYTENSNLPHGHGELQLNKFEAFPKNPPISKVFREIGYADELGSGMRNTNKYTKLYSGGTPTFIEDNIFRINIPIDNVANLKVGPGAEIITNKDSKQKMSDKMSDIVSDKMSDNLNKREKSFLETLVKQLKIVEYVTTTDMSNITNIPASTIRRYMKKFCELGILSVEGKNKNTQYRLNSENVMENSE